MNNKIQERERNTQGKKSAQQFLQEIKIQSEVLSLIHPSISNTQLIPILES